jgi:hypothetical protein
VSVTGIPTIADVRKAVVPGRRGPYQQAGKEFLFALAQGIITAAETGGRGFRFLGHIRMAF